MCPSGPESASQSRAHKQDTCPPYWCCTNGYGCVFLCQSLQPHEWKRKIRPAVKKPCPASISASWNVILPLFSLSIALKEWWGKLLEIYLFIYLVIFLEREMDIQTHEKLQISWLTGQEKIGNSNPRGCEVDVYSWIHASGH